MTFTEYNTKYGSIDHALIRMTDSFPFFKEKVFIKNGRSRTESNYHIADGLYSTYINYEMPGGGISAEISGHPRFEISCNYDYPVFITNVDDNPFEVHFCGKPEWGEILPNEVLAIYPESLAKETYKKLDEDTYKRFVEGPKKGFLSQEEINRLLGGE